MLKIQKTTSGVRKGAQNDTNLYQHKGPSDTNLKSVRCKQRPRRLVELRKKEVEIQTVMGVYISVPPRVDVIPWLQLISSDLVR